MRISLNWLKTYVDIDISAAELAERLTMVGFEVESIEHLGEKYNNFIIGEVVEISKHPNANKLTLCKVNIGKEILSIVCGAPNAKLKQKVVVGRVGATVPHNQHDPNGLPFVLTHVKIRGEGSFGMICSEYELGLGDNKDGIMVLPEDSISGCELATFLGLDDTVFEVGITPNRPDAMSHIGIAREVAAMLGKKLKVPSLRLKESKQLTKAYVNIKVVDSLNCPRYSGRIVLGVKIEQSPKWLQSYLKAVNIRPINNVVDITNFVLMEVGQPLHAFDYDKITDHTIIVRKANAGETFTSLDHKGRSLSTDTLMIVDSKRSIAIAGIMGGAETEITESSKNIFIESAYFDSRSVRRSAKRFGLSTDASQRFERGSDPSILPWAADRASQLIQEICGGEVLKNVVDIYPKKIKPKVVNLRPQKVNEVLGITIDSKEVSRLLHKIDIRSSLSRNKNKQKHKIQYIVPHYRPDIEAEIDLIEEVARLYGYNNIETNQNATLSLQSSAPEYNYISEIRDWLIGSGYSEIISNSMQDISLSLLNSKNAVEIANPITQDMAVLRTSLIPGMVRIIKNNISQGNKNLRFFEFGKTYFFEPSIVSSGSSYISGFFEENRLILGYFGQANKQYWNRKAKPVDILDVKGDIQTLFQKIFLDNIKFIPYSTTNALTNRGLVVEIQGIKAGEIALVSNTLLEKFDIDQSVYIAEIKIDLLLQHMDKRKIFKHLPKYPVVNRDVAFIVAENVSSEQLINVIQDAGSSLLLNIELFDIYQGNQVQEGKKSLAFSLEFLSYDHTLNQVEIDRIMQIIINKVSGILGGKLRS